MLGLVGHDWREGFVLDWSGVDHEIWSAYCEWTVEHAHGLGMSGGFRGVMPGPEIIRHPGYGGSPTEPGLSRLPRPFIRRPHLFIC